MIDRQTVDKIMDATNIVEVVSDFVSLRKRGTSFKGLCPFHDDTTPSFSVSPSKGVYKCFACGKAGNAVNFIMEHEQISYTEALKWLAKKYHIEVKEREITNEERLQQSERESMFIVNEWAANYFNDLLHSNIDGKTYGLQYFRHRGFSDETIEKFRLGYALRGRDPMMKTAESKGYKVEYLLKTGLCGEREGDNGYIYDRFSNRVIFPWINIAGKVVAFGGRLLDSRTKGVQQKYVNSPDSDIYHKDHELYGIFQAKRQIVKEDRVYMVEGYTDVVSMHQCGIENVVANSGTALSFHQIKLLRRFTSNITLLYDGDEAGIHAALRGTDMLLSEGMNVKVLLFPDQEDPDSFAQKHTAEEFKTFIEDNQTDFIQFKTEVLLKGVTDPIKRSEAISNIIKSISVIKDPIIRATYIKDFAQQTGLQEQTLITQMNRFIRDERYRTPSTSTTSTTQNSSTPSGISAPSNTEPATNAPNDAAREVAKPAPTAADIHVDRATKEVVQMTEIESMIVQMVVRYGEQIIFRDIALEDNQTINLSLAEYVHYDLSQDNMQLGNPLYNKIIEETFAHVHDEDFKAEQYLLRHSDFNISQLASQLSIDRYVLTKSLAMQYSEEDLRNQIVHLLLDYKLKNVITDLKQTEQQIKQQKGNDEQSSQLMSHYIELLQKRNIYAKHLGNDIIN